LSIELIPANEVVKTVKEKRKITFRRLILNEYFLYVVSFLSFLVVWHYIAVTQTLGKSLSPPGDVIDEIGRLLSMKLAGKNLLGHIWASSRRILIGFALGAAVGIPLGVFMALNKYVNAIVKPVFDLFKPMPPLAWISIAILWFGIAEPSKVFIIFIGSVVPCVLNSYAGIRIIDKELYDVVRTLGGKRWQEIVQVSLPAALPALFAGLQISISIAWTCVLAAELVSSRSGLGWIILRGMRLSKPELVIGGMIIIAVVAWVFSLSFTVLEKLICPWKRKITEI
jgi:ABC-type nitrate/sulfonate/bicarbonate transport system permease component